MHASLAQSLLLPASLRRFSSSWRFTISNGIAVRLKKDEHGTLLGAFSRALSLIFAARLRLVEKHVVCRRL
jgi:hypothetical protein